MALEWLEPREAKVSRGVLRGLGGGNTAWLPDEVLRLHFEAKLSRRAIGRCLHISQVTVSNYLERFDEAGLSWPLPDLIDEAELERRLFPVVSYASERPEPDWVEVHRELKASKAVTLHLLWLEYKALHVDGYQHLVL